MCIAFHEKYREKRLMNIDHCDSSYISQVSPDVSSSRQSFVTTVWCTVGDIRSIVYTKKRIRKGESGIKLNKDVMTKEQSTELKKAFVS